MKLIKTATSGALIAALSLSVGCASTPDAQNLNEEPAQETSAISKAQADAALAANSGGADVAVVEAKTDDKQNEMTTTATADAEATASAAVVAEESKQGAKDKPVVVKVETPVAKESTKEVAKAAEKKAVVAEKPQKIAENNGKPESKIDKKLLKNALNISEKDLPVTLELWTLRKGFQPGEGLELSTPTLQMGDGDYLSQIRLTLTADQLVINSSSDIDTSLSGVGVRYNGGTLIPIDRVDGGTIGVIKGDWMSRFAEGGNLEISLGFFPDKAQDSPVFKKEASINALSKLVPTYYKLK